MKTLEEGDQRSPKYDGSYHFQIDRNDRSLKWYLEDEVALAKDIFWSEKQRMYSEAYEKAIGIAKKKKRKSLPSMFELKALHAVHCTFYVYRKAKTATEAERIHHLRT